MNQYQFEYWQHPQQKQVNHFYKSHQQNVSCHNADKIYLIRDNTALSADNAIIAATFIRQVSTENEKLHLLRSLYVSQQHRNKGLATQLLQFVLQDIHPSLTVICEAKLTPLYLKLGFDSCDPSQLIGSNYLSKFIHKNYEVLIKAQ